MSFEYKAPVYIVRYEYGDVSAERMPYQSAHRDFLDKLTEMGLLVAAGPVVGKDIGILMIRADDIEMVEEIVDGDPYRQNDVVRSIDIMPWLCRVGTAYRYINIIPKEDEL